MNNISKAYIKDILSSGAGSTGSTFQALLKYVSVHQVLFLAFENVIQILQDAHYSTLVSSFEDMSMAVHADVFRSDDFGLPQKRERAWGIAVRFGPPTGFNKDEALSLAVKIVAYVGALMHCVNRAVVASATLPLIACSMFALL